MEETVGTGSDGLVAVDASRADDADGRLLGLHHTGLHTRCVGAQNHVLGHVVGMLRYEECVLHVAGRMVGSKVHLGEHVQVVFHLRAVGQYEAHAREDVDDLVLHDGQRMAGAQLDGVGRARQVDVVALRLSRLQVLAQAVDAVEGHLFQFVDAYSHRFLLIGGHIAEVLHQGVDLAFLAQVLQSQGLYFLSVRG